MSREKIRSLIITEDAEFRSKTIAMLNNIAFAAENTWTGRAVGGCTYFVSHPGGRAHDDRPRNALEAEGRRGARFYSFGHTPGALPETVWQTPPRIVKGYPLTLDLRR